MISCSPLNDFYSPGIPGLGLGPGGFGKAIHEMGHSIFEEPIVELAPHLGIHRCLEHIWKSFNLRARLFLLEGDSLILRDCVGEYSCYPEIGLKIHPGSLVWEIFQKGKPANLTESYYQKDWPHSLPEPVTIKAVIPLKRANTLDGHGQASGVLVVDAGDSPSGAIEERDFQFLEVLGILISEILEASMLMKKIKKVQQEKEIMEQEVAHIFRNSFTVIGGFARKIGKIAVDPRLKKWGGIIINEARKGESALLKWRKSHEEGEINFD